MPCKVIQSNPGHYSTRHQVSDSQLLSTATTHAAAEWNFSCCLVTKRSHMSRVEMGCSQSGSKHSHSPTTHHTDKLPMCVAHDSPWHQSQGNRLVPSYSRSVQKHLAGCATKSQNKLHTTHLPGTPYAAGRTIPTDTTACCSALAALSCPHTFWALTPLALTPCGPSHLWPLGHRRLLTLCNTGATYWGPR